MKAKILNIINSLTVAIINVIPKLNQKSVALPQKW